MNEQGYIRIPRSIFDSWIWDSSTYYQWYSDLCGLASFKDRSTLVGSKVVHLRKGQLVGSIQFFVTRWKRSKKMILHFFDLLQTDGYIIKESSHNVSIITVMAYYESSFEQDKGDNLLQQEIDSKSTTCNQNESNLGNCLGNNHGNTFGDDIEDDYGNDLEDILGNDDGENPQKKSDIKENIEKKEIKKERTCSSPTSSARAKGDFFEVLDEDLQWKKTVASRFQIEESSVSSFLMLFRQDQKARGRTEGHKDIQDFKAHFCDWLRKELASNVKSKPQPVKESNSSSSSASYGERMKEYIQNRWFHLLGMKNYKMYISGQEMLIKEDVVQIISPHPYVTTQLEDWKTNLESVIPLKIEIINKNN